MRFEVAFKISPSGLFGVPEDGRTVMPSVPGEYLGDPYHTRSMTKVGHGTLPQYRHPDEAIKESFEIGSVQVRVEDNYAFLKVDAENPKDAYDRAQAAMEVFLQHLAVDQQRPFSYELLYSESEDGKAYPPPRIVTMSSVTMYNLGSLRESIRNARRFTSITDERLQRALQYFEHAVFLFEARNEVSNVFSRHFRYLISAIFLNLWKAVTTIVGDPSTDHDYRSRYKKFGIEQPFFEQKIEGLRKLRNDYDVAHYHVAPERVQEIERNYYEASVVASEVINHYREFLLREMGT